MAQITSHDFKLVRGVLGLTRAEMAPRLKCSTASVYLIERGKRGITPAMEVALLRVVKTAEIRRYIRELTKLTKKADLSDDY